MDRLFCLDNRVIGGASDRIADLADLGQFVDQQLFLGHVDSSEAKIVRHDILGVAELIGAFDLLALPGSAGQVLRVDRLADLAIAVFQRLTSVTCMASLAICLSKILTDVLCQACFRPDSA
jgi:hypothetical protein